MLTPKPLLDALPYGVAVLGIDQLVLAGNERARELLPATVEGTSLCHDIFRCNGPGEPCADGCLGLRAAHSETVLPEVRLDAREPGGSALWVTYAPLRHRVGALLHLRPGVADDRRRRSEPHWIAGPQLRIHALGRTTVQSGCSELGGQWLSERPGQVLKYLLCHRAGGAAADEIAEAIWPGSGAGALNSTRHAVHRLRSMLDPGRAMNRPSSFVSGVAGGYALDPRHIWIDVDEFERAVDTGLAAFRSLDLVAAKDHLQRALDLYRGEFLADEPYADWALEQRSNLHELAVGCVRALAVLERECDDAEAALGQLKRLCELEPYDDGAHREYITALYSDGRLGDAKRCFTAFAQRMQREFGEVPSFDLRSLRASTTLPVVSA